MFFILIGLVIFALFSGAEKVSLSAYFDASLKPFQKIILFDIRLPRILLCLLCGVLLGGCGAVFQGFFRNPLADSGILGISSGATLGAIAGGMIPFFADFSFKFLSPVSVFAFAGGLGAGFLVFVLSFAFRKSSSVTLLLTGTALGTFISSISSFLMLAGKKELRTIFAWTMGSFNSKGWDDFYFILIPSLLAVALLLVCARSLDVLGSGETTAVSLGLNIGLVKFFVLISGSLATACAVCGGGIISFVGLISPHIVRKLFGTSHKIVIPLSMVCGSVLLLFADTLSRILIAPSEIPVGIITALIGVPFFIMVLRKDS